MSTRACYINACYMATLYTFYYNFSTNPYSMASNLGHKVEHNAIQLLFVTVYTYTILFLVLN